MGEFALSIESSLLGLFVGLIVSLVFVAIWQAKQKLRIQELETQVQQASTQLSSALNDHQQQQTRFADNETQLEANQALLAQAQVEAAALKERLTQLSVLQKQLDDKEADCQQLRVQSQSLEKQLADIAARSESDAKHHAEQIKLLNENKDQIKKEFSNLANDIFEQKQKRFSEQSQQSIQSLLDPFNKQIEQFRKRVDDIHTKDAEGRSQLLTQLSMLKDMNTQLNKQADDLTKALKGDKKLQGNWGELQIERILEASGLQKGREFEREANFKDEDGKNFRPDFIIHLPDGKHIIVDSKVSLNAYQKAVSAEDDVERELAIKEHVNATRTHIRSLSDKNYPGLAGVNAPDFVLMFMPIESAFIAAFESDPNLFNDAFERHIVVVTPTTLLATLRTVANLWVLERQNENAKELYTLAGKIYDKYSLFSDRMEKLGSQLDTAQKTYQGALTSLSEGKGSMTSYVERLKDIGAPTTKKIAESVKTSASLEAPEETDS